MTCTTKKVSKADYAKNLAAAERQYYATHGAWPFDRCHTCKRKIVKGAVECIRCSMEKTYGKY